MGIVFRQSVKTSFVVLFGAILGALTIWLSTKYISDKQQFGFTRNLTSQALTLSQILLFGMSSTLFTFTHRLLDNVNKKKVLVTICLSFPFVFTILASIIYFFLKGWVLNHFQPVDKPLMERYYIWLPIYTLLFIYLIILEQYLGLHMKVAISAFMREIVLRVLNLALIILFAFNYISFHFLVISSILIYIIPILSYLYFCFNSKDFGFSLDLKVFSRSDYKEMFHFAWYHFLLSIAIILMSYLDQLLLPLYDHTGFVSVAVYSVTVYVISFLQMPSKAFLPATFSNLTAAITEKNMDRAKDIFIRSSLNILIPTVCIAAILYCNLDNGVMFIGTGKNYADMKNIFLILFIGQFINLSTGINDQILSITNYYKFIFYVSSILTVLLFVLLRLLVPRYGVFGAAWSTTITISLYNIAKYFFVWYKLNMQPFSKSTLLVLLAGVPALVAGYFFPHFFDTARHAYKHIFMDVALRSLIIMIIYFFMLVWLRPSPDLTEYIQSIRKNKRLF